MLIKQRTGKGLLLYTSQHYGFDVSGESPPSDKPQKTKIFRDNGMLYLILHDLSREFIRDLLEVEQIPLNEHQQKLIEDKIKGFYRRIIDHPALTNDRVIFAPKHPDFQHLIPDDSRELSYPSDRLVSTLQNEQHSCPEPLRDLSKEDDDSYVTTSYPSLASYT
ncbi:nerve growth factor-like protein [Apostichopus japonicus]|uniref:Nerve growth factor-like protein n=1 Tax=Stichopus japonicus TaxID=307972 RepID=A0A2G8KFZ5_STIJA|nr:nerve growth factor-like protein [Apostichopus japonicus]